MCHDLPLAMPSCWCPAVPLPRYDGLRMGLPAERTLRRLWGGERPHIVHVVTEGPLGRSAVNAARLLRIPVSSDFHTNFDAYSEHYGFGLLRPLVTAYLRRFHNGANCTFVPTRQLCARLEAEGYRDLLVVARGVDTTLYSSSAPVDSAARPVGACKTMRWW